MGYGGILILLNYWIVQCTEYSHNNSVDVLILRPFLLNTALNVYSLFRYLNIQYTRILIVHTRVVVCMMINDKLMMMYGTMHTGRGVSTHPLIRGGHGISTATPNPRLSLSPILYKTKNQNMSKQKPKLFCSSTLSSKNLDIFSFSHYFNDHI